MKHSLNKFILSIPTLFIKQYPYAWVAAVVLWSWPPGISILFLLIVACGIFALRWRSTAWIAELRQQHAPRNETFCIDHPPIPWERAARNIAILLAGTGLLAWLMNGKFGLSYWQSFLMLAGFALFYLDTRFFGAETIYVITGGGIGIYYVPGHTDYRIFLRFNEMGEIVRLNQVDKIPASWSVCARSRAVKHGILLVPRHAKGFTKLLDEVLLVPTDMDEFLKQVPSTLVSDKE